MRFWFRNLRYPRKFYPRIYTTRRSLLFVLFFCFFFSFICYYFFFLQITFHSFVSPIRNSNATSAKWGFGYDRRLVLKTIFLLIFFFLLYFFFFVHSVVNNNIYTYNKYDRRRTGSDRWFIIMNSKFFVLSTCLVRKSIKRNDRDVCSYFVLVSVKTREEFS